MLFECVLYYIDERSIFDISSEREGGYEAL